MPGESHDKEAPAGGSHKSTARDPSPNHNKSMESPRKGMIPEN